MAFVRHVETSKPSEVRLFTDPLAVHFLDGPKRALARFGTMPGCSSVLARIIEAAAPGLFGAAVGRTRFIDDALRASLAAGVDQIVILGAGYDCRAYRLPEIGETPLYEVDHPATQARKRALLAGAIAAMPRNVTFVPVDFERQRSSDALIACGFRQGGRTFVVWEGVTQYLTRAAIDATLDEIRAIAAPGSTLVFTYEDAALVDGSRDFPGARRLLDAAARSGEPYRTGFSPGDLGAYLLARGFELLDDVAGDDFARRYLPRGERRLVAAEFERAALARTRAIGR